MTGEEFESFVKNFSKTLEQPETENNWSNFEDLIKQFEGNCSKVPADLLVPALKLRLKNGLIRTLATERTRLARSALSLISELSVYLKGEFEQLSDIYLPAVLKLTSRANKVYVQLASETLKVCIKNSGIPSFIPNLLDSLKSASKTQRIACAETMNCILKYNQKERIFPWILLVEFAISEGITDSSNEVRDISRLMFDKYKDYYPERLDKFADGISDMARRYLKLEKPSGKDIRRAEASKRLSIGRNKPLRRDQSPRKLVDTVRFSSQTFHNHNEEEKIGHSKIIQNLDLAILDIDVRDTSKEQKKFNGPIRVNSELPVDTPKQTLSQARRVLKPAVETKPRLQPAQRVRPADLVANLDVHEADQNLLPSSTLAEKETKAFPNQTKVPKAVTKKPVIESTGSKKRDIAYLNIDQLGRNCKNTDWAKRNNSFEELDKIISTIPEIDYTSQFSTKIVKMLITGLSDIHFKVLTTTLTCVDSFIRHNISSQVLSKLLPNVLGISHFPHHKTKVTIMNKCTIVLDSILLKVPLNIVGTAIVNAFGNANYQIKIRVGCLAFLAERKINEIEQMFSKMTVCKTLIHRLAPFAIDSDHLVTKLVFKIFEILLSIFQDAFVSASSGFTLAERLVIEETLKIEFAALKLQSPNPLVATISYNEPENEFIPTTPTRRKSLENLSNNSKDLLVDGSLTTTDVIIDNVPGDSTPVKLNININLQKTPSASNEEEGDDGSLTPVSCMPKKLFCDNVDEISVSWKEKSSSPFLEEKAIIENPALDKGPAITEDFIFLPEKDSIGNHNLKDQIKPDSVLLESHPQKVFRKNSLSMIPLPNSSKEGKLHSPITNVSVLLPEHPDLKPKIDSEQEFSTSEKEIINCHDLNPKKVIPPIVYMDKFVTENENHLDKEEIYSGTGSVEIIEFGKADVTDENAVMVSESDPETVHLIDISGLKNSLSPQIKDAETLEVIDDFDLDGSNQSAANEIEKIDIIENYVLDTTPSVTVFDRKDFDSMDQQSRTISQSFPFEFDENISVETSIKIPSPLKTTQSENSKSFNENRSVDIFPSAVTLKRAHSMNDKCESKPKSTESRRASLDGLARLNHDTEDISALIELWGSSDKAQLPTVINKTSSEATIIEVERTETPEKDLVESSFLFDANSDFDVNKALLENTSKDLDSADSFDVEKLTNYLRTIFKCGQESVKIGSVSLGYTMSQVLHKFESIGNNCKSTEAILNILDENIESQMCFEMLTRLLPNDSCNLRNLNIRLCEKVAEGINSRQSSTRKSAFELATILMKANDEEWSQKFYGYVKKAGGAAREMLVKKMIEEQQNSS